MDLKQGFSKTRHEACPACRAKGADTRGDNLARYPDGHAWCFSCGHYEPTDEERKMYALFRAAPDWRKAEIEANDDFLRFPDDFDRYIPKEGMEWFKRYGITNQEIIQHRFGWSQSQQLLIMPVFDKENRLLMWQGRFFKDNSKLKYLTKGPKSDIVHIVWPDGYSLNNQALFTEEGATVILTEGLLDAIKVGRVYPAMPVWGSKASLGQLRKLSRQFSRLGVWLDPDKTPDAVRTAIRASQFVPSFVVTSTQDPKNYMDHNIRWMVGAAGKQTGVLDAKPAESASTSQA